MCDRCLLWKIQEDKVDMVVFLLRVEASLLGVPRWKTDLAISQFRIMQDANSLPPSIITVMARHFVDVSS